VQQLRRNNKLPHCNLPRPPKKSHPSSSPPKLFSSKTEPVFQRLARTRWHSSKNGVDFNSCPTNRKPTSFWCSPPKGGHIVYSGGQTGTIEKSGHIDEDPVPNYRQSAPVRAAYLTVFDAKSRQSLWTDSHQWGGLLTGHNSAGARLISQLKKEMKK